MEFREMGKIARLSREMVVTEKIDGTNANVLITADFNAETPAICVVGDYALLAGSRTRWITPEDDNFGFAKWVREHADELTTLGPGHHFGEWWGRGVQREYGLKERRFSLFNVGRWDKDTAPSCCHVVPVLHTGPFSTETAQHCAWNLQHTGSLAAPDFMDPEGIVVFHEASGHMYKKTLKDDDGKFRKPKVEREPRPDVEPQILWTGGRRKGATPGYAGSERRTPK